jgi:hypothetical protein
VSVAAFDPLRLLKTLQRNDVRFVVIGGIAGRLWGSPTVTNDLDICYARDGANLESLAAALRQLKAKLRGTDRDLPFQADVRSLRLGDSFTFVTSAGNLDCLATPAGTTGYEQIDRTAIPIELGGITVAVASIEDLILMKRASARPKDLIEVEILTAVRDETGRR